MRARRDLTLGALALSVVVLTACSSTPPRGEVPARASADPSESTSRIADGSWWVPSGTPATLATGLRAPWSVVALPDGGALISERDSGTIRELTASGDLRTAGVVPDVVSGGEAGLHGLARWEDDRTGEIWLYAYHGAVADNRVVRILLSGEPGEITLGVPEVILAGIPRARNHDGGRIAFGPDGYLYVATGDAGNREAAQDPQSLGGKILRLTPTGDGAPGNPFQNEVWTLGHRNVQGLAWTDDRQMWASEFGQNTWDELNHIVAGGNYGWPIVEGDAGDDRFTDPVMVWAPSAASPSGIAAVGSTVFVAALRGERMWVVDVTATHVAQQATPGLDAQGRLRDVVAAPDGALWILTSNTDGRGSPRPEDDILIRLPIAPRE